MSFKLVLFVISYSFKNYYNNTLSYKKEPYEFGITLRVPEVSESLDLHEDFCPVA